VPFPNGKNATVPNAGGPCGGGSGHGGGGTNAAGGSGHNAAGWMPFGGYGAPGGASEGAYGQGGGASFTGGPNQMCFYAQYANPGTGGPSVHGNVANTNNNWPGARGGQQPTQGAGVPMHDGHW